RPIESIADRGLVGRTEVVAVLERKPRAMQHSYDLVVRNTRERRRDALELRRIALEDLQLLATFFQGVLHDASEECLGEVHEIVERRERDLRLDHPELREVSASLALLRTERRPERVHLPERHRGRLGVELARLREERLLAEVVDVEKRRRSLARGRREDRRID